MSTHSCTHWLRYPTPPLTPHSGSNKRALLVSQDRRHPCQSKWMKNRKRTKKFCITLSKLLFKSNLFKSNLIVLFRTRVLSGYESPDSRNPDLYVFGPSGSRSVSKRYGTGSRFGIRILHHQAEIVRKPLVSTILWLLMTFYLHLP